MSEYKGCSFHIFSKDNMGGFYHMENLSIRQQDGCGKMEVYSYKGHNLVQGGIMIISYDL